MEPGPFYLSVFFTGSSKASNDSLFNVESWKIRSLQHLAPLSPKSLEIWCEICTHYLFNQPSNCSFSRWYRQEVRVESLRGMRGLLPSPGQGSPQGRVTSWNLSLSLHLCSHDQTCICSFLDPFIASIMLSPPPALNSLLCSFFSATRLSKL